MVSKMRQSPLALSARAVALLTLMGCPSILSWAKLSTLDCQNACTDLEIRIHMCDYVVQNSSAQTSFRASFSVRIRCIACYIQLILTRSSEPHAPGHVCWCPQFPADVLPVPYISMHLSRSRYIAVLLWQVKLAIGRNSD